MRRQLTQEAIALLRDLIACPSFSCEEENTAVLVSEQNEDSIVENTETAEAPNAVPVPLEHKNFSEEE